MIIPDKWLNDRTKYTLQDVDEILEKIRFNCSYVGGKKVKYLNIPISLDLETSSFLDSNGEKTAIMYIWMIGIYGLVITGRTWNEYSETWNKITSFFSTSGNKKHLICYIHNASYDFQFIRKHHTFLKVFATGKYAPLYALTNDGIEFRCSYRLTTLSLEKVGKGLIHHKINKLSGNLDYSKLRHSKTPLTDEEYDYCINDAKVVNALIAECISEEGDITKIPLTNTGYVRRDCKEACFKQYGYHKMIKELTLTPQEFMLCRDSFMGGFVHSNPIHSNEILHNVTGLDIKSSYPTVIITELYPCSKPKHVTISKWSEFKFYLENYCCIFNITMINVKARYHYDYYLSASKCEIKGRRILSNGRIVSADELNTIITNVDFDIIEYMYDLHPENIQVNEFIYFERDYLPTPFVKQVLLYYSKKTTLSGIKEQIAEYNRYKRMVNSTYGMTATNPNRDEVSYVNNEWTDPETPDINIVIDKYNKNYNRFLYYPWAVFITAYARHAIWESIIECGDDHVYSDTDSEKCLNFEKHKAFFESYNKRIQERLSLACKVHGIDVNMIKPKNNNGEINLLGTFENEGTYTRFKTIGAKRYMYELNNKVYLTCSGVNPKKAMEYMNILKDENEYFDPFDYFTDEMLIPSGFTGRMTMTYINERKRGIVYDYLGNPFNYDELSAIYSEPSDFNLDMSGEFLGFMYQIKNGVFDI